MTATMTPYRSGVEAGRAGFRQVLRAEWTKFRTVRGWVIGTAVALLVMVLLGLVTGLGSHSSYNTGPGTPDIVGHPPVPTGPDGEAVTDGFYFVHRSLAGDGSITARVTSLTGSRMPQGQDPTAPSTPEPAEVQPWAKAGLIIKENTAQGSAYAAIMVTGAHGVRMQHNYTGDTAGPAGTVSMDSPRWLRLTRTGDTVTGYASTDGTTWTTVGTVRLAGLPATVPAGLFATSPRQENVTQHLGGGGQVVGSAALATARFDTVDLGGGWSGGGWSGDAIGTGDDEPALRSASGFQQSGDSLTVTGAGDIAPDPAGSGDTIEQTLAGAFATLTVMVVIGVLFITGEYRRGMIRTSLAASPRRGHVLAAKAVVIGAVTFVVSLVAVAVTIPLTEHFLRVNGNFIYPITGLTQVRVVAGMAALLAVAAVFALAVGTILRRSAGAVATVIVLIVLPYILATAGVLPAGPSQWLLRISPAAGFAIQQSIPAYPQVGRVFTPAFGFYPLAPWAGFAVLCGWTALALAAAAYLLRRRDA